MKKNILLLVASVAVLASCGGSTSAVSEAPALKEEASLDDVKASAKKAVEAISTATGASAKVAASATIDGSVTLPGAMLQMSEETVELKEKLTINEYSLEEKIAYKDEKLAASGSAALKADAELDLPKFAAAEEYRSYAEAIAAGKSAEVPATSLFSKNLSLSASGKTYLQDGKAYLDGSGAYDAYSTIFSLIEEVNIPVEIKNPISSADDLKVFMTLPEGTLPEGNPFASITEAMSSIDALTEETLGDSASFGKFADGSYGFTFDLASYIKSQAGSAESSGFDFSAMTAKLTVTFTEAGSVSAYVDFAAPLEFQPAEGVKVKFAVSAKAYAEFKIGEVTVDTLSDTSGFKEVNMQTGSNYAGGLDF